MGDRAGAGAAAAEAAGAAAVAAAVADERAAAAASNWKATAAKFLKDGYQPGNAWETRLRRSLEASNPSLLKELGPDLTPYLQVRTARALAMYERLTDQGTDPETARELAMHDLLGSE